MPLTLDSFNRSIPVADFFQVNDPSPAAVVSGSSTRAAEPPGIALPVPFRAWNSLADDILNNHSVRNRLAGSYLPSWEEGRYFGVEGDVVDASCLQLTNPVDLVLSARHRHKTLILNQHSVNNQDARADRIWYKRSDPAIPNEFILSGTGTIAILDYKRAGVIRPYEFAQASVSQSYFNQMTDTATYASFSFESNSSIIMRQAVHYANSYNTRFVAFFDWTCLLLIVLDDLEENLGGEYCYITLVTERAQMRRALLGFLEGAYQICAGHKANFDDLLPNFSIKNKDGTRKHMGPSSGGSGSGGGSGGGRQHGHRGIPGR
ncbi:hypothetical protein SPI_06566 [Niveomyces insectorum RCEF 264]|uniref:Uncharacterized protein n=1 Tax=Niveomyces insectorum RCEF 264 TaxID=1081102 RepID=A0A167RDL8_9HYPO|nr:hypothetical protein SPI_06566 [Niveomyces insectorum RCEF 264]